jgi:hypothetical protein
MLIAKLIGLWITGTIIFAGLAILTGIFWLAYLNLFWCFFGTIWIQENHRHRKA